ncbi:MAG: GEVED domain-containing protein [Saprospiraceae bacterium]
MIFFYNNSFTTVIGKLVLFFTLVLLSVNNAYAGSKETPNPLILTDEICGDGIDNDGDGFIDCGDPDCSEYNGCDNAFSCTNDLYQVISGILKVLDTSTGTYTDIGGSSGYNGAGYNVQDGYIYGIITVSGARNLRKIDNTGTGVNLGPIANFSGISYAGDFDKNGNLYTFTSGSNPKLNYVDVDAIPLQTITVPLTNNYNGSIPNTSDITFNPVAEKFYGMSSSRKLVELDPINLTANIVANFSSDFSSSGGFGAAYSDASGNSYFSNNTTGNIYMVTFDGNGTPSSVAYIAQGEPTNSNDGMGCFYSLPPFETSCTDGIDNDGDGLIDCDDPDCSLTASIDIENEIVCIGDTSQLNATTNSGDPGITYSWSPVASLINGTSPTASIFPTVNTDYTVTVTTSNGCTDTEQISISVEDCSEVIMEVSTLTSACPGSLIPVQVTIYNDTKYNASGISVQDMMPAGFSLWVDTVSLSAGASFDSITYPESNIIGNLITWEGFNIPSGDTIILNYSYVTESIINIGTYSNAITGSGATFDGNSYFSFDYTLGGAGCTTPTFSCRPAFYQTYKKNNSPPQFAYLNVNTGEYEPIAQIDAMTNGMGFDINTGLAYGSSNGNFVSLDSLGVIRNMGLTLPKHAYVGDMDPDGNWYGKCGKDIVVVDVSGPNITATYTNQSLPGWDMAYHLDGNFYAMHKNMLYKFDTDTNTKSTIGQVSGASIPMSGHGAQWVGLDSMLYISNNRTGEIFRVDVYNQEARLVMNTTANLRLNDGFSCPDAIATPLDYEYGDDSGLPAARALTYITHSSTNGVPDFSTVWLGDKITADITDPSNNTATGDDYDDGIEFPLGILPDSNFDLDVVLNTNMINKMVYYGIWIDWEGDNTFDTFVEGSETISGKTTAVASIPAPANLQDGTAKIRVRISESDLNISNGSGDLDFGEVEDYQSDFRITGVALLPKVYLQSVYDESKSLMTDGLRTNNYIPTTEPYTTLGYTHVDGGGGETCTSSVFTAADDDAIVDWIVVELRDATDPTVVLYTRAALLQRDGDIVDTDGTSAVFYPNAFHENYYVAVKHRNHLGVMTATALSLDAISTAVDFTTTALNCYKLTGTGASDYAQKVLDDGTTRVLWGGNNDFNDRIIFQGLPVDPDEIYFPVLTAPANSSYNANYVLDGYYKADTNLDGSAVFQGSPNDVDLIFFNILGHPENTSSLANFIIYQQIPE